MLLDYKVVLLDKKTTHNGMITHYDLLRCFGYFRSVLCIALSLIVSVFSSPFFVHNILGVFNPFGLPLCSLKVLKLVMGMKNSKLVNNNCSVSGIHSPMAMQYNSDTLVLS